MVVSADDVTHENNLPFIGTGFMAAGAATVEKDPAKAAVPFGATRNGMILGSGASAFTKQGDMRMVADQAFKAFSNFYTGFNPRTAQIEARRASKLDLTPS